MALDERYLASASLTSFLIDKTTGLPLDGSIEFWKDSDRATPKLVYQLAGSPPNYTYTALPNSMDVVGGNPVNDDGDNVAIYYYPYDENGILELYYVVVKDADGVIQEKRPAWPDMASSEDPTLTENSIVNALDNSQFVEVLFSPTYGVAISIVGSVSNQVYTIAPNWALVVSTNGNATITVNRTPLAGSLNIDSNPPYTLDILTSGANISSLKLRQRLSHNPGIFANGYIAGYMVASSVDGVNHELEMEYAPSVAPSSSIVCSGSTGVSGYVEIKGTIELPPSVNTSDADSGYIDINVILPVTGHYNVTSIQLVGMEVDNQSVAYDQQSVNRQKDSLFGYYNPLLQYKPQGSYLIGWDFHSNPSQWGAAQSMSTIGANKAKYLWDQTIGYQSVNNSWAASRHAIGGLVITASTTTQPAIIQYLPQGTARAALLNKLSVFLRGNTNKVGGVTGKVSLWYTTDANVPDLTAGTNNSLISTISSTGKPTAFNGNWTEVTRSNLGDAEFTFSTGSFVSNEKHFSGWGPVDAATSTATYMAIVIGFSSILTSENIIIDTVSLSPGDIAAIENPYGFDSILLDCRRFYEQSYSIGVAPGTATVNNEILVTQDATNDSTFVVKSFQIKYLATKYSSSPLVYIYSPSTGTVDRALYSVLDGGAAATRSGGAISTNPGDITISTNWTSSSFYDRALFTPSNTTTQLTISGGTSLAREALLKFHYVVDSRIGLI